MATSHATYTPASVKSKRFDQEGILPADIGDLLNSLRCIDSRERHVLKGLLAGKSLADTATVIRKAFGYELSREALRLIGEKAMAKIGNHFRPGAKVEQGAVERFRAAIRQEEAERLEERAGLVKVKGTKSRYANDRGEVFARIREGKNCPRSRE